MIQPSDLIAKPGEAPKVVLCICYETIDPGTLQKMFYVGAIIRHEKPRGRCAVVDSPRSMELALSTMREGLIQNKIQWDGRVRRVSAAEAATLLVPEKPTIVVP